jgi:hemoglobin-like flavoprotein
MSLKDELLESSFAALAPQGERLVKLFYEHLFTDFPAVLPLFAQVAIADQQQKLLASLKLVVENLRRPEVLTPALENLGLRHIGYGAREEHYPAVGQSLLKSLAQVTGPAWSNELNDAWAEAYGTIVDSMLRGASQPTN